MVRSGRVTHAINDYPFPTARGDVYLTPPGSIHGYRDTRDLRADVFCFQAAFFSLNELQALHSLSGFRSLFVPREDEKSAQFGSYRLHLTPEQLLETETMLDEITRELNQDSPVAPLLTRALFFRLLVHLARASAQSSTRLQGENGWTKAQRLDFREVLQLCDTRFHEPLCVPQLARLMFFSTARFSAVFKRETGVAPATYIRRLRLQHAQTLLRTTKLSSDKIARQSGFADGAQLARTFRRDLRTTPLAYRAEFGKSQMQKTDSPKTDFPIRV